MIAASRPIQRPRDAKLLVVRASGEIRHAPRSALVDVLEAGDVVVANDAATLPASLAGTHLGTGAPVEVRLAGRASLDLREIRHLTAVVFGAGDYRTRTEERALPPPLSSGDRLVLGPLQAVVQRTLGHPRLVQLELAGSEADIWAGIARHGRPIQYAHVPEPLSLWDVWTPLAGPPVAFEPPSAGFALDHRTLARMRQRSIELVTLTHAASISSTGDAELDRSLPLDEPFRIPESTAKAIASARDQGHRVVAVGTTVVRALEQSARDDGVVQTGDGVATGRIGPTSTLRIVDAIVSGTHEPGTSHFELLRAFASDKTLTRASAALERGLYLTHEFGDSVLLERSLQPTAALHHVGLRGAPLLTGMEGANHA
jgi:S-adenosylmethionine:tRNA ribosyltransferase-isomerase